MLVNQPEQRPSVAIITRLAFVAACLATAEASPEHVQLKYLGTAGWEISDGRTVVLIDPYLSRLRIRISNDVALADDSRRLFTRDDVAESDVATIDAHIRRADFILITHTHADHAMDLPYIATKTGAIVVGSGSTRNLPRRY